MVPPEFTAYFTAAAATAGVPIGLLLVAVSLRPENGLRRGRASRRPGSGRLGIHRAGQQLLHAIGHADPAVPSRMFA
jgi:hypothetical protein